EPAVWPSTTRARSHWSGRWTPSSPSPPQPPSPTRTHVRPGEGGMSLSRHDAAAPAVAEIDGEAEEEPDAEPQPVLRRQGEHQQETGADAEERNERHERRAEGPRGLGVRPAHDEHRRADDDERQERPDVD